MGGNEKLERNIIAKTTIHMIKKKIKEVDAKHLIPTSPNYMPRL